MSIRTPSLGMENLTVMGMPVRWHPCKDGWQIVHPSGRIADVWNVDIYHGGFDVLRDAAAKLKREVDMGCGPTLEFSGAVREMMQHQQQWAMQQQMLAQQAQSQLSQAMGLRGLAPAPPGYFQQTITTDRTSVDFEQLQKQLESAKQQMEQQYSEQYYSATTGPKVQEPKEPDIDSMPVLTWLKRRVDDVWHKGIDLVKEVVEKKPFLPAMEITRRIHGVLTGGVR